MRCIQYFSFDIFNCHFCSFFTHFCHLSIQLKGLFPYHILLWIFITMGAFIGTMSSGTYGSKHRKIHRHLFRQYFFSFLTSNKNGKVNVWTSFASLNILSFYKRIVKATFANFIFIVCRRIIHVKNWYISSTVSMFNHQCYSNEGKSNRKCSIFKSLAVALSSFCVCEIWTTYAIYKLLLKRYK